MKQFVSRLIGTILYYCIINIRSTGVTGSLFRCNTNLEIVNYRKGRRNRVFIIKSGIQSNYTSSRVALLALQYNYGLF